MLRDSRAAGPIELLSLSLALTRTDQRMRLKGNRPSKQIPLSQPSLAPLSGREWKQIQVVRLSKLMRESKPFAMRSRHGHAISQRVSNPCVSL